MSEWRSFVIYEKKLSRMMKIVPEILIAVNPLITENSIERFNYAYYDDEKPPHVSIRFNFRTSAAREETRRRVSSVCSCFKVKWRERPYREKPLVKLAYVAGSRASIAVLALLGKKMIQITRDPDLRMHMIHGFINNLGLGYLSEMRSYGLAIHSYSTKLMKVKELAKVK